MRRLALALLVASLAASSTGCLVLSIHPAYDESTIGWDPNLVGAWFDADDNASLQIQRGEWKSYRIHYVHPIESGDLTGYLTMIGNERFLDVTPMRGEDPGSFLIPVHVVLRLRIDGDRLELTPLAYDWFFDRLKAAQPVTGLRVAFDQKDNVVILSEIDRFRSWLRVQSAEAPAFGAAAVFTRKPPASGH